MISRPNTKTGIESFSIHNKVCDKIFICKLLQCRKYCYYNKFFRLYKSQNKLLMKNYKASLKATFGDLMNTELKTQNIRYFRIHVCGEFYSQEYFDKWRKIAKSNREVIFYTYTRNVMLNFKRPKNFLIYISDDFEQWDNIYNLFDGVARIRFDKTEKIPRGFKLCKYQTDRIKCIECKLCLEKGNKVIFNKH